MLTLTVNTHLRRLATTYPDAASYADSANVGYASGASQRVALYETLE